ncbi:MAG: RsiV family protein [Solitalea-like symbiont of Acarus siro]
MKFSLTTFSIVTFYIITAIACNNSLSNKSDKAEVTFSQHNINKHVYRAKNTQNELIIDINYLIPENIKEDLKNMIDSLTYKTIAKSLNITDNKNRDTIDSEDKLNNLINAYVATFCNGEPLEKKQKWKLIVKEKIVYQNEDIISFQFDSYQLSGNAKTIPITLYINLDKNKSQILSLKNLTRDNDAIDAFNKIGELEFRRKYKIHPNESFTNTQFMFFDNNTFRLPENFTFTKNGILFIYNVYEIAPYSSGKVSFTIPYNTISDILNLQSVKPGS